MLYKIAYGRMLTLLIQEIMTNANNIDMIIEIDYTTHRWKDSQYTHE